MKKQSIAKIFLPIVLLTNLPALAAPEPANIDNAPAAEQDAEGIPLVPQELNPEQGIELPRAPRAYGQVAVVDPDEIAVQRQLQIEGQPQPQGDGLLPCIQREYIGWRRDPRLTTLSCLMCTSMNVCYARAGLLR